MVHLRSLSDVVAGLHMLDAHHVGSLGVGPLSEVVLDVRAIGSVEGVLGVLSAVKLLLPSEVAIKVHFL